MAQFKVEITRHSYSTKTFVVEAKSKEQAEYLAMEEAGNTTFEEDDALYDVNHIIEI